MTTPVPAALRARPFTLAEAERAGLSRKHLRGRRFRPLMRGLYACRELDVPWPMLVVAVLRLLPAGTALSHLTALRWYGVEIGPAHPLHFSTDRGRHSVRDGVHLHRREGTLSPRVLRGVPVLGPDRTVVDCALLLGVVALVQAAEMLIHLGLTTADRLRAYADSVHLDGVIRSRRALRWVRDGAESPRETLVRLMLVFARLPEPRPNVQLHDALGRFLGRADLVYERWRVVVEYDGVAFHDVWSEQRRHDRRRRAAMRHAGWAVVVVTHEDLREPAQVVAEVHAALVDRGYDGPTPVTSETWRRWFTVR